MRLAFLRRLALAATLVLSAVGCSPMHRSTALAQSKPLPAPQAGPEFQPVIGQPANANVVARRVDWPGRRQPGFVLFDKDSEEVLVAGLSTNRLCYLNGKFYTVAPVGQGLMVTRSEQLGTNALTSEKAVELALKTIHGGVVGYKMRIDLKPLLKQEEDEHRAQSVASGLSVPKAEIMSQAGNLRIDFKSSTGFLGTVFLTPELKVLSTTLTGFAKWMPGEFP